MPKRVPTRSGPHQRLVDAMMVTAARYGYGGASVARVVRQARVSRATFYEHFADRDDCFLAAYREVGEIIRCALSRGGDRTPGAILGDLLRAADEYPETARVGLIESLAAGAEARREHELLLSEIEAALEHHLQNPPPGSPLLEIPARAVFAGVAGVVAIRVFRGEAGRLRELRDELLGWIDSYALPEGQRRTGSEWAKLGEGLEAEGGESLGPEVLGRRLPRGRAALPPALVAGEQRERVLAAVAELSRIKGYTATTVADVVATAGVTREAFYDQFRSKEDAFLAAQTFGLEGSVSATVGKFFGEESWPDRVWSGLEATLSYIAGQRNLVYVDLVESYAAGTAAIRRSFENRMAYTLFLEDGYRLRPEAAKLPRLSSEAISGAMQELFRREVVAGRSEQMLELLPLAAYLTLAPFMGAPAALDSVESKVRERKRRSPESPDRA